LKANISLASKSPAGRPSTGATPAFKVISNRRQNEVVVKTLVGHYAEKGSNHGRKYYQKTERIPGHEDVDVFLYYWDARDGADFSGWWFGDKLGGTQVWAKASVATSTPPKNGWNVPWDAKKSEPGVIVVEPVSTSSGASTPAASTSATQPGKARAAHATAGAEQKKKETEKKVKEQEEKDSKEFRSILIKVKGDVKNTENEVEKVVASAGPLIAKPQEEGEALTKQLEKIEAAAEAAQKKVVEKRNELVAKLNASRNYTGEAKSSAVKEFAALQGKLAEVQKKLSPYRAFKKEFAACVAASEALAEITEKFGAIEPDIEKATLLCKAADIANLSEDEVNDVDKLINPASKSLTAALQTIAQRTRGANAATASKLEDLKKKGGELRQKIEALNAKLSASRQIIAVQTSLVSGQEKVLAIEALWKKCQDAEMPFLKGIEVLPKEESDKAIGSSEAASSEAVRLLGQALPFLRTNLANAKKLPKDQQDSITDQLGPILARAQTIEKKITDFRKETAERKMNALLAEAMDAVVATEKKAEAFADAAKKLAPETLEETMEDDIKKAIEQCNAPEKEALASSSQARNATATKQREAAKVGNTGAQTKKIQDRLNAATAKISKQQQAVASAEKFVKAKAIFKQEDEKMKQVEADVGKVEQAAAPVEAGGELTEDAVKIIDEAMASARKVCAGVSGIIQPFMNTAPTKLKAELKEVLDRKVKALEKLDKLKNSTKEQREKVLAKVILKEGENRIAALDAAIEKTSDAEVPFLKGIEVLPLQESLDIVTTSEKAAAAVQEAITAGRSYVSSKGSEARAFGPAEKKAVTDGLAKVTEQINEAAKKVAQFNKDTAVRKKAAQIEEAGAKVNEVETEVKNVAAAAEPFIQEDAKDMSEEAAAEPLKAFLEAEKAAVAKMSETRAFLAERQRVSKDNASHMETIKKLQARVAEAQTEMTKAKQATAVHESRFLAKRLVAEVTEQVGTLDAEVKKATDACAPLLQQGAEEQLVETSVKVLATALTEHMKEKELGVAELFKKACGGKKFTEELFTKYVAGLAEGIGKEEVNFPDERRKAIFQRMDADKDGAISKAEFEAIFRRRCVVRRSVTVTDGFSLGDSKTLCKVDPGDEVELFGVAKEDDSKMLRSECKLLKDGTVCWVTIKGNAGGAFVEPVDTFAKFCLELDKSINQSEASVNKVSGFLNQKMKEGGPSTAGPLKDARDEMAKLRPQITAASSSIRELRAKLTAGKAAFRAKEKSELNAHIEEKERKAAAEITGPAIGKVEAAIAAMKAVEAAGEPLVNLSTDDELKAFATPAAVADSVEELMAKATPKVVEAREAVKEQVAVAVKVSPPTNASSAARVQLQKMTAQIEQSLRTAKKVHSTVKAKCDAIVDEIYAETSMALRKEAHKKNGGAEGLFADLAKGDKKISVASFCAKVQALEGLSIPADHAKLLCRKLEASGISQRVFLSFVQLYYSVVKDIAVTDVFDVNTCKTLRKVEKEELLEVVEGPQTDESVGLTRVLAKSIVDGTSGWVTLQGNQGTPFLAEVEKPFYVCRKDVLLAKDFKPDGEGVAVRTLKGDEVLELIEGPRSEACPDVVRARVKATKDGAQGWVTLKDKGGVTLAEENANLYVCKTMVAMTDAEDITTSKVLRKLAVDEMFVISGEIREDAKAGISRAQGKAVKDGKEGWITTKGNAGTIFVEPAAKYYSVLRPVDLQKRFASEGAETTRSMEVGETFQVLEGPREEKMAPEIFMKVRAVSDRAVGWVMKNVDTVEKWTPMYRCVVPTPIEDTRGATEATKSMRDLLKGEQFELLEGPVEEGKEMRMMGVAKRDGVTGWVTIKGEDGKRRMEC